MTGYCTHSRSLRVVGQLLQERGLDLFDLKIEDDKILLQCGDPVPPHLDLVQLSYSIAEIRDLDELAKTKRGDSTKLVDFESLPEIFRAIGGRIDEQKGRLLRACNAAFPCLQDLITVEYQTRDKRRRVEELFISAAGDQAMRMYKHRSRPFN